MDINLEEIKKEITFKTSRSGGAGGQNVNKVETKVTLFWSIRDSNIFSEMEKRNIMSHLGNRINTDGFLQLESSETRSQLANKEVVIDRFVTMLKNALAPKKKRIPTKIPRSKVLERLDRKSKQSQKKINRNWRIE